MIINGIYLVTIIYANDNDFLVHSMNAFSNKQRAEQYVRYEKQVFKACQKVNKSFAWTDLKYEIQETSIDDLYS